MESNKQIIPQCGVAVPIRTRAVPPNQQLTTPALAIPTTLPSGKVTVAGAAQQPGASGSQPGGAQIITLSMDIL